MNFIKDLSFRYKILIPAIALALMVVVQSIFTYASLSNYQKDNNRITILTKLLSQHLMGLIKIIKPVRQWLNMC